MICRSFKDSLEEYVDGTLSPGEREAVERHLARCAACREALWRRHQIGRALSNGLQQATVSLRLLPAVAQRVLRHAADRVRGAGIMKRQKDGATGIGLSDFASRRRHTHRHR